MSRTAWLTWCRISRQHSAASSTFSRSAGSSAGKGSGVTPQRMSSLGGHVRGRPGGYLCSARCSVAAAGTWSAAASPWGSCPLTVGAGIVGGSRPPEEQAGSTGVARGHAHGPSLRPGVQSQPSSLTPRTPQCPHPRGLRPPHLHEGTEPRLLALLGFELLQSERLAAAEAGGDLLEPRALGAIELQGGAGRGRKAQAGLSEHSHATRDS